MAKLKELWNRIKDSLWLVPGLITLTAAVLAVVLGRVDSSFVDEELAREMWWLFGGTADGGREVLSVIAGSIITVTGVVFSITIVALQLASTQLSPRVLRTFMADRWNQSVLGVFIGTFTYALLVLRVVRRPGEEGEGGFLPSISITVAVVLMLVSIGFLIFYIHHAARSIQAAAVVDRVTQETHAVIRTTFPEADGRRRERPGDVLPAGEPGVVRATAAGYVVRMDAGDMLEDADGREPAVSVRLDRKVGDFVLPGESLASVWPREALDAGLEDALRENVVMGAERTPHQDVEFGLIELVDIAVKALSPGINDPNTAVVAIDRLLELFHALGTRELGDRVYRTEAGTVLLMHALDFEGFLRGSVDPIRHFGAGVPLVAMKLVTGLGALAGCLEGEARAAVGRCIADVARQAAAADVDPADRHRVREAAGVALAAAALHPLE